MQIYKAPVDDIRFLMELFDYTGKVASLEAYQDFDLESAMAIIDEAAKFNTNEMLPLNRIGDQEGLKYNTEDFSVTTAPGFKELYDKFVEAGLVSLTQPAEFGGSGAPHTIGMVMSEFSTATNKSFSMCPGLTHGVLDALHQHGTQWLKETFMPKLISGEWSGTMCLTEPHCGTDLGMMRTKAVPNGDDTYAITGNKIWITFGEHDLTDNIVHLVLARLPDAPEGIKGISLFVVPKFDLEGNANNVLCGGLEHKMGIHASPTCVMNFENSKGWLVGEPHKGMRAMFTMMNAARLLVGIEGLALGEIAYQTALEFAKDRRQSRSLDPEKRDLSKPADNILVHPDVRRMMLNVKSTNEAMRALGIYCAINLDMMHHAADDAVRDDAADMTALLTPIIKSYFTERGFDNISDTMQVCGGSGYTTDWSIEQYLRDARIAMIYEGTNHIQALDLVGRKLPDGMGRMYQKFASNITKFIQANKDNKEMEDFIEPLKDASKKLNEATMGLSMRGMQDPEEAGAVASNYLNLFALTALAWMWGEMAAVCVGKDDKFSQTKLKTGRYFMYNVLPEIETLVKYINTGKKYMMDFEVDEL